MSNAASNKKQQKRCWISVAEAASLEGVSERRIRQKLDAKEIHGKQQKSESGGGAAGRQWLIDPESLSAPARVRWLRQRDAAAFIDAACAETAAGAETECLAEPDDDAKRINPAAYQDALGMEVYERMMEEARQREHIVTAAREIIESRDNVTERIMALAATCGRHHTTIYRWVEQAAAEGVYGLVRKLPTIIEGKTFRAIDSAVSIVIKRHYLAPGEPKSAAVYRKTVQFCRQMGLKEPSRATVFRFIEHLEKTDPSGCFYARKGYEAWAAKYAPHAVRAEPDYVMQVVMGDHHQFDLFIEYNKTAIRPWVTLWLDVKSRCPVGWTVTVQPNSETIGLALVHMMTPKKRRVVSPDGEVQEEVLEVGGIPSVLYVDNGKDYRSALKKKPKDGAFELSREGMDLCQYLGIRTVWATPYHAAAKSYVERFFGTVAIQFSREQPGWCGSKPEERAAGFDENKLLRQDKLLSFLNFAERFNNWVMNEYWENEHSGIDMTPLAKHLAGPKVREGWPSPETLDVIRCVKEEAKVMKEGIMRFGRVYWADELAAYAGTKVIIRYDPGHIGELIVSTANGKRICTATNRELMGWDVSRDDMKALGRQKKLARQRVDENLKQIGREYAGLEQIASDRKAAGPRSASGDTAAASGMIPAITGLDQLARETKKDKQKRKQTEQPPAETKDKQYDPIEELILNRRRLG